MAETEAGLASGLNNAVVPDRRRGRRGDPVHASPCPARTAPIRSTALTNGYQSAFAAAIAVAALGVVAASLLLGARREPEPVAQAEPAIA